MPPSPSQGSRSWFALDSRFAQRSFLLGLVPMVVLLALMSGSFLNALQMILFSTICSAGIGGLFWAGVAMLIGTVMQLLLPRLRARPAEGSASGASRPNVPGPGGEQAIEDLLAEYASARLRQGASKEGVRRDLRWSGWSEAQATAALDRAGSLITATAAETGDGRSGDGG